MSALSAALLAVMISSTPQPSGSMAPSGPMTEQAVVDRALHHLGVSEAANAAGGEARAAASAHTALGPTSFGWDREHTFGSGGGDEDALTVGQSFQLSGRAGLRAKADELRGEAAVINAGVAVIDLEAQIRLRFHAARAAAARVAVLEIWQQRLTVAEELVEVRVQADEEAGWARIHTHHELARAEMATATAIAERDAAQAELAALIGLAPEAELPELVSGRTPDLDPRSLRTFLARLDEHPAVRSALTRERAADQLKQSGERAWVPSLDVAVGYKTAGSGGGRSHGYVAGLNVSVPLGGDGSGESARGEALAVRARAEARTWRGRQEALVRRAFARTVQLAAAAAKAVEHLAHGHEALLKAAALAYQGGELDLDGMLEAQADARDDRLAVIDLTERAWQARVQLDRWSGGMQ